MEQQELRRLKETEADRAKQLESYADMLSVTRMQLGAAVKLGAVSPSAVHALARLLAEWRDGRRLPCPLSVGSTRTLKMEAHVETGTAPDSDLVATSCWDEASREIRVKVTEVGTGHVVDLGADWKEAAARLGLVLGPVRPACYRTVAESRGLMSVQRMWASPGKTVVLSNWVKLRAVDWCGPPDQRVREWRIEGNAVVYDTLDGCVYWRFTRSAEPKAFSSGPGEENDAPCELVVKHGPDRLVATRASWLKKACLTWFHGDRVVRKDLPPEATTSVWPMLDGTMIVALFRCGSNMGVLCYPATGGRHEFRFDAGLSHTSVVEAAYKRSESELVFNLSVPQPEYRVVKVGVGEEGPYAQLGPVHRVRWECFGIEEDEVEQYCAFGKELLVHKTDGAGWGSLVVCSYPASPDRE